MNDHLSFLQVAQQEKLCCAVCTEMIRMLFQQDIYKIKKGGTLWKNCVQSYITVAALRRNPRKMH